MMIKLCVESKKQQQFLKFKRTNANQQFLDRIIQLSNENILTVQYREKKNVKIVCDLRL